MNAEDASRNQETLEVKVLQTKERSEFHVLASIAEGLGDEPSEAYAANHTGRNALSGVKRTSLERCESRCGRHD